MLNFVLGCSNCGQISIVKPVGDGQRECADINSEMWRINVLMLDDSQDVESKCFAIYEGVEHICDHLKHISSVSVL